MLAFIIVSNNSLSHPFLGGSTKITSKFKSLVFINSFASSIEEIPPAALIFLPFVMCFLKIPLKRKNHYFCSQFVAEVLQKCQVIEPRKRSTLYFAKDISKHKELELVFQGTHSEYIEKYVKSNK